MISDKDWAAMDASAKATLIEEVVFDRPPVKYAHQALADFTTWQGTGLVIDRMTKPVREGGLGWVVTIESFGPIDKKPWAAEFVKGKGANEGIDVGWAEADSAPSAIALAALRAVQED